MMRLDSISTGSGFAVRGSRFRVRVHGSRFVDERREVLENPQAGASRLLRVELNAPHVLPLHGRGKRRPVRRRRDAVGGDRRGVGVREVHLRAFGLRRRGAAMDERSRASSIRRAALSRSAGVEGSARAGRRGPAAALLRFPRTAIEVPGRSRGAARRRRPRPVLRRATRRRGRRWRRSDRRPGTTIPRQRASSAGAAGVKSSAPTAAKPLRTEVRLPAR